MNAARYVVADGAVAVDGTTINAVGAWAALRQQFPDARVVGSPDSVVTPGYINAHQHLTGDRLVRSCIPDNIDSQEAIVGWAVPVHAAHTADDDHLSTTLSLVEAVGNGITCTVEAGTVAHPDHVAAAMTELGARGTIGRWGWDVGDGPHVAPANDVIDRIRDLVERYPRGGLVEGWVTLVGHDLMTDELVAGASQLARDCHTGMTFHLSPHRGDPGSYLARTGVRPVVHLDRLDVLGPHVLLGHGVHLDDDEVETVLRTRTAIASCPWAYLRLAQGVTVGARYAELFRRGGRLALGCDSENAGDAVDALRAGALFIGLARDAEMDPFTLTAQHALELLTIRGAEAIGMDDRIGSIEVGKQADLVVHDTSGPQWIPRSPDPVLQLVWASDGRSVSDVMIAGRQVVRDGRCITVDVAAAAAEAASRQRHLLRAAGKF
jgi:5-methylthioadenosine/S-adenosylhomocysteine deaminase